LQQNTPLFTPLVSAVHYHSFQLMSLLHDG
jgi:hypothetical protein